MSVGFEHYLLILRRCYTIATMSVGFEHHLLILRRCYTIATMSVGFFQAWSGTPNLVAAN
jgi:hypothetical protein